MKFSSEWREAPETDGTDDRTAFQLPAPLSWDELRKPVDYGDNLLGNRFLERGQGFILYGPSGCGKSVAALQAQVEWSAGQDGLHITPSRPLRIVILQTEDSINDIRESLDGILSSTLFNKEHIDLIKRNLIILPALPGGTEDDLRLILNQAAEEHKPDMISLNPLLAFCTVDPTRELGGLLYQVADPVIKRHHIGFLGVHHTPKTNNRDTSGYGVHDHQYLAAGDARVANWPRAMMQIEPVADGIYRFRVSKRGHRSGWTCDGKPTNERYFRHAQGAIRWIDAMPADVERAKAVEDYRKILEVLPNPDQPGISRDRLHDNAKNKLKIGKDKANSWLKLVIEDGSAARIEQLTATKRKEAVFRRKETAEHAA